MDTSAKQQVVERLKTAQNILVTVSANPSVDQLAACIGLTLLLNKLGKHSTAVFSGTVPSTLEFLQPEKTIEHNTDSLRDFIISLDKEKADKLRYKVEDDVVKIFITPYRTSLSEKDLVFSQGDFNVEAVVALGVKDKGQLDAAITAHGRILHDATVISVNAGDQKASSIGQVNWQEPSASSLSEMIVSMSEALGSNLIDNQMATAFLTGIVAETQRFSNPKTSPKVMTMSAQLMAAGANQQLIVSKLETVPEAQPVPKAEAPKPMAQAAPKPEGELEVKHAEEPKPVNLKLNEEKPVEKEQKPPENEIKIDIEGNLKKANEPEDKPPQQQIDPIDAIKPTQDNQPEAQDNKPEQNPHGMPGSHTLLSPMDGGPILDSAFTANTVPSWGVAQTEATDPFSQSSGSNSGILNHAHNVKPSEPASDLDLNQLQPPAEAGQPHVDMARNAVESAFAAAPFDPALNPVEALNSAPIEASPEPATVSEPANQIPDQPAPPPVPPPLMPAPGVVIPSNPVKNGVADDNTL